MKPQKMKFYSISQYPGTTGQYYYNFFLKKCNIYAEYIPLGCNPENFENQVSILLKETNTLGISISMPYKQTILSILDKYSVTHDLDVKHYGICNTVVTNSKLMTFNCDVAGVEAVTKFLKIDDNISILGDGAMSKMFYGYLIKNKYSNVKIYSRKLNNWNLRHAPTTVVINCTAMGTISDESPLDFLPKNLKIIIDLAIKPGKLKKQSERFCKYVDGLYFYHHQFINQFYRYTGVKLELNDVTKAGLMR